ncbi:MAG: acyltransferase [Verrucomicrobiota bacterium]
MTGLRFFAAVVVFFEHVRMLPGLESFEMIGGYGGMGVSVFFVLSGFIIAHNYLGTEKQPSSWRGTGNFYLSRFSKIYPLHLLFLLIALPLAFQSSTSPLNPSYLPQFITLADRISPWGFLAMGDPPNKLAWTLSCEIFFYLLTPLLFAVIAKLGKRQFAILSAFILAFGLLQVFIYHTDFLKISPSALYATGPFRLLDYLVGIALLIVLRGKKSPGNAAFLSGIVYLVMVRLFEQHLESYLPRHLTYLPGAALLIFGCPNTTGWLRKLLTNRISILLGNASFALYISHEIILRYARYGFSQLDIRFDPITGVIVILIAFAGLQFLSIGLFRYYELPVQKWLRSKLRLR